MVQKENRRVKMTKLLLKNSLIELMRMRGINKITIREICENADVNRSTFYIHYADQFALLKEIEDELLVEAESHLQKMDSYAGSIQYLEGLLGFIEDNADIFKVFLCRQENLSFQTAFIKLTLQNLEQILRPGIPEKVRAYVYDFLIMGCLNMIKRWIESDFELSRKELADLMFSLADKSIS